MPRGWPRIWFYNIYFFWYHFGMKNKASTQSLVVKLYKNPQYKGKHIIIIGGQVYATKTGKAKSELLGKLLKKFPRETPTITYIPKVETLILLIQ